MRTAILLLASARLFAGCDFLIQGAVDWELQPLVAALADKQEVRIAAWSFWTGRIGARTVVISRTDVGPINAAAATARHPALSACCGDQSRYRGRKQSRGRHVGRHRGGAHH